MVSAKIKKPATKLQGSKKKGLNTWIVLGGVIVVVVFGIVIVRFSSASSRTFSHYANKPGTASQLAGGTREPNAYMYAKYKAGDPNRDGYSIRTLVSSTNITESGYMCAHMKATASTGLIVIALKDPKGRTLASYSEASGYRTNDYTSFCVQVPRSVKADVGKTGSGGVLEIRTTKIHSLAVDVMYGRF